MKKIVIFEKSYGGEELADINRDVSESFDKDFNPIIERVPVGQYGLSLGTFKISIVWKPDDYKEEKMDEEKCKCSRCGTEISDHCYNCEDEIIGEAFAECSKEHQKKRGPIMAKVVLSKDQLQGLGEHLQKHLAQELKKELCKSRLEDRDIESQAYNRGVRIGLVSAKTIIEATHDWNEILKDHK